MQRFSALCLDDHPVLNDQVGAKATVQLHGIVNQGHRFLAFHAQAEFRKFMRETGFVCRFQQSWSQTVMDLDGGAYDFGGQVCVAHFKILNRKGRQDYAKCAKRIKAIPFWDVFAIFARLFLASFAVSFWA